MRLLLTGEVCVLFSPNQALLKLSFNSVHDVDVIKGNDTEDVTIPASHPRDVTNGHTIAHYHYSIPYKVHFYTVPPGDESLMNPEQTES